MAIGMKRGAKEQLEGITAALGRGEHCEATVRELLRWFGAERRGSYIVADIRRELRKFSLATDPDFEGAWIDGPISFVQTGSPGAPGKSSPASTAPSPDPVPATPVSQASTPDSSIDPVQRIGRLKAANQMVTSVAPGVVTKAAITLMLLKDYSQVPIIQGRECKGAVTWRSVAAKMTLGHDSTTVNDCMEPVEVVGAGANLFDVIPKIVKSGFVLVQANDRTFQGIVTTADISLQFGTLSEPFLLLGQIENHIRRILQRVASKEEIRAAKHPGDTTREVNDATDLSFGEYVRLLEPQAMWDRVSKALDRAAFLADMKLVQSIRNDVMHFDPDGVAEHELVSLRNFARFLESIDRTRY